MKFKSLRRSNSSHPLRFHSSLGLPTAITLTLLAAAVSQLGAQTVTWGNTGGATAWYTNTNWSPSTASGAWLTSNIAQFANAGTATTAGINMGTSPLSIGAIEVTSARARALTIGNSSGTTGNLTLNGATVNGVANVILRNASTSALTLQDNETGTGKTMGVVLGNATDNRILLDGTGNIVISSIISGVGRNLSVSGSSTGQLVLSTGNTYTGNTTLLTGGTVSVTGESAFGANPVAFVADQITFNGGTLLATANVNFNSNRGITIAAGGGTLNAASAQTITLTNAVAGSGLLTKTGAGTLALSATNSYSGGTNLGSGVISIANSSNIGSGAFNVTATGTQLTVTGTAVTFANNFTLPSATGRFTFLTPNSSSTVINGTISGGNANTVASTTGGTEWFFQGGASGQNSGALTLNGNNSSMQGTINVQRGPLILGNANAAGTTVIRLDSNNNASGALQLSASVNVANQIYLQSGASQNIGVGGTLSGELSGVISSNGALGFTKVGTGSLKLSGANTYTGGTTISAGTLQFAKINAMPAAGAVSASSGTTLAVNVGGSGEFTNGTTGNGTIGGLLAGLGGQSGGTVSFASGSSIGIDTTNAGGSLTYAGNVTNSGLGLTKLGTGTLILSGPNTYTGTTTVSAGTLSLSGGAAIADTSAVSLANTAGATLRLDSNETIASIGGGGTIGGNIDLQANTLSLAGTASTSLGGTISGTGGAIIKSSTSTGTLALTGTNTYTGGTSLNGGGLSLSNGSAAGTGAITIGTGATSGTVGGVSTILVNNTAATTLANNIALASPNAATTYTLMKATASASTGTQLNLTGDISGGNANSTFRLNSNTGGDNTTTYRLAGNNSFQGNLELYRGAIVVTNNNSLGTAKLLLNGNNNDTLGDLRFENSVTLANDIDLFNTANPDPIHTGGNTVTLGGTISSSGDENLVKIGTGTLILTGANTYGVGTTISGGTLQIGNGGTTGNLGSGAVTNNAALVFNRSNNFSVSTTISGTGTVTKEGDGIMTLLGINTYTGSTTVNDGALAVNGTASASAFTVNNGGTVGGTGTTGALTVTTGGRVGPGNSAGILNTGNLDLQSGGFLDIELNGATAGTGYDQLNVTGSATIAGLLSVTMGYTPVENSLFFILLNDGNDAITGTFTGLANESVFNVSGQDFRISYFADSTGNTFTGGNDIAFMAVPEPSASLLAGFALTALLIRRRR